MARVLHSRVGVCSALNRGKFNMKSRSTSAIVLVVLGISVFAAAPGFAVPTLQLDIVGGSYDEATETIIGPSGEEIVLVALLTAKGNADVGALLGNTYFISAALLPAVAAPGEDLGSFTFTIDSTSVSQTVDVTDDMFFGVPPLESMLAFDGKDLSKHGVFETYFSQFGFMFDEEMTAEKYNSQETPGGLEISEDGVSFYQTFTVNTALLAEGSNLHFDLYTTDLPPGSLGDIDRDMFAPFSHDAETDTNGKDMPEPITLLLLGTGLSAIAVIRRRKESR